MSSLANRCLRQLASAEVVLQLDENGAPRIPARCPEVGDLVNECDNEQNTVLLGNSSH